MEVPVNYNEIVSERINNLELEYEQTIAKTEVPELSEEGKEIEQTKNELATDYVQLRGDYDNLNENECEDDFYEVEEMLSCVKSTPEITNQNISLTKDQSEKIKLSMQSIKLPTPKWAEQ